MAADKYRQALSYLLPAGYAWPRDPASVLMCTTHGVADAFAELGDFTAQSATEWLPHATRTRLEEWEEACGLPDACFGTSQLVDDRQRNLLVRLRGAPRAYADSSPAAPDALAAVSEAAGVSATVHVNYPFRVGDRAGSRLGKNGRLHVIATHPYPVLVRAQAALTLGCVMEAVVPARFEILISFPGV